MTELFSSTQFSQSLFYHLQAEAYLVTLQYLKMPNFPIDVIQTWLFSDYDSTSNLVRGQNPMLWIYCSIHLKSSESNAETLNWVGFFIKPLN